MTTHFESGIAEMTNPFDCSLCGMSFVAKSNAQRHEQTHKPGGYRCSVCGTSAQSSQARNYHELHLHRFERFEEDRSMKEGVKIKKTQLTALINVGFMLVDVQNAARSSAVDGEEASVQELTKVMKADCGHPSALPPCPTCGMCSFLTMNDRGLHVLSHVSLPGGFICSICGIQKFHGCLRNTHERQAHNFVRPKADVSRQEAIQISEDQKRLLKNVGINFEEIQRTAVSPSMQSSIQTKPTKRKLQNPTSPLRESPVFAPPCLRARKRSVEVITLEDSDDDSSVVKQKPLTHNLPQLITPPVPNLLPASSSQEGQPRGYRAQTLSSSIALPPSSFAQPPSLFIPTPANQFNPQQPSNQFNGQPPNSQFNAPRTSYANEMMRKVMERPQFMFYDFKQLGSQFNILPVSVWSISAECSVLVLRLDSPEWKGTIELDRPFDQFSLYDQLGYFLLFAKPEARVMAARLNESIGRSSTFDHFVDSVVRTGFKSALFIADDGDHESIRGSIPGHYSVV